MKKRIFVWIFSFFVVFSVLVYWDYFFHKFQKSQENFFVTIPHHNLIDKEIDKYYAELKKEKKYIKNIVIISPNHFYKTWDSNFESFPKSWKYCFWKNNTLDKKNCLKVKVFDESIYNKDSSQIFSFDENSSTYFFNEHWVWNHFQFINKYFPKTNIYSVILKINKNYNPETKEIYEKLKSYNLKWNTLFIASVDFSHHVNEKIAKFHDKKTVDVLNKVPEKQSLSTKNFSPLYNDNSQEIEVDCPNCLFLEKNLANNYWKNFFEVFKRTSSNEAIWKNVNYDNTSYVMWEFSNSLSPAISHQGRNGEEKMVYWMFFGDLHFTRWFTYSSNKLSQENYLECFYHNKDFNKKPDFWHNRMFYSFDIVWANLETSVASIDECQKSQKEIVFRTEPDKLDLFKSIWINTFTLSNNHSYDCWASWYEATKKYLDEKWFNYFWDWRKDESIILKKEINWIKVAFVWLNDVDLSWKVSDKISEIKKLKKEDYLVILNIHWGTEYKTEANERQKKMAREFVDAWVNMIIWHHPHVVQNYEVYKWTPIFYSLWNFIFDQPFPETLKWYGVVFAINKEKVEWDILEFTRNPKTYKIDCESFK